jgi:TonB family protein
MKNILIGLVVAILIACTNTQKLPDLKNIPSIKVNAGNNIYWDSLTGEFSLDLPRYKIQSKRYCVNVSYVIRENGTTSNIEIKKSYPNDLFNPSIIKAVSKWKYSPTKINSSREAVHSSTILSITSPLKKNAPITMKDVIRDTAQKCNTYKGESEEILRKY